MQYLFWDGSCCGYKGADSKQMPDYSKGKESCEERNYQKRDCDEKGWFSMSVMMSGDRKELVVNCDCTAKCDNTIHFRVDKEDNEDYMMMTYLSGNWYHDQDDTIFRVVGRKLRKIWAIIRNKDFYYSDVVMTDKDFAEFKEYVNQFGGKKETGDPDKVREAILTLREELLKHGEMYNGFLASIKSALDDYCKYMDDSDGGRNIMVVTILKRLVGE